MPPGRRPGGREAAARRPPTPITAGGLFHIPKNPSLSLAEPAQKVSGDRFLFFLRSRDHEVEHFAGSYKGICLYNPWVEMEMIMVTDLQSVKRVAADHISLIQQEPGKRQAEPEKASAIKTGRRPRNKTG